MLRVIFPTGVVVTYKNATRYEVHGSVIYLIIDEPVDRPTKSIRTLPRTLAVVPVVAAPLIDYGDGLIELPPVQDPT